MNIMKDMGEVGEEIQRVDLLPRKKIRVAALRMLLCLSSRVARVIEVHSKQVGRVATKHRAPDSASPRLDNYLPALLDRVPLSKHFASSDRWPRNTKAQPRTDSFPLPADIQDV